VFTSSQLLSLNRLRLRELHLESQSLWRSKHYISVIKTGQVMLYREIIAVCSEIHTKHVNALCGRGVELLNVKPDVICPRSNCWASRN